jgi:hypothetical protein
MILPNYVLPKFIPKYILPESSWSKIMILQNPFCLNPLGAKSNYA